MNQQRAEFVVVVLLVMVSLLMFIVLYICVPQILNMSRGVGGWEMVDSHRGSRGGAATRRNGATGVQGDKN